MERPNESYNVIIAEAAAKQLVSHAALLANVSVEAAERLVESFETAAITLKESPHRCPWLRGDFIPGNTYRFLIFETRYMLLYQIRDKNVYVDYLIDQRQDYKWLLR